MQVHWRQSTVINDYSNPTGLCVSAASSIGIGVFLIVGYVAKHVAGPATVVSVLIAATIAVFTALFYAELSQRLPRKASPYTFSNVCLGRLAAFFTGWTLILEYVVAVAVVAKGIGLYLDSCLDEVIEDALTEVVPIPPTIFGEYFDFFGFGLVLVIGVLFLIDLRRYHLVDSAALALCLAVVIFIITTGAFNANPVNWTPNPNPEHLEPSGFFPYGVLSIFRGAAMFSFAFIAIESLIRPRTKSPRSCGWTGLLSFGMLLASLLGCSIVLTLMWPHNLMHQQIPFPHAFSDYDMRFAQWIVSVSAIILLSTSLWTLMFPLKRQILALAEDGLLPFPADNRRALGVTLLTVVALSGLMSGLFSMGQLIDLLSVGTLLMFIVIAVAIVMLRFSHQLEIGSISAIDAAAFAATHNHPDSANIKRPLFTKDAVWTCLRQMTGCGHSVRPTSTSFWVVKIALCVEMAALLVVALLIRFAGNHIYQADVWAVVCVGVFAGLALVCFAIIALQPMRTNAYYFAVPCVTPLSTVSLFVCILLVVMLDYAAWVRFVVWVAAGVPLYVAANRCAEGKVPQPKWRPGGISKIQGMHNRGFVADTSIEPYILTSAMSVMANGQMVEIQPSDDSEQFDTYCVGAATAAEAGGGGVEGGAGTALQVSAMLVNKSRTPSPSSSLDDIVLASDIIETLSERKEPNGKVYFVDEIKSVKSSQDLQQKSAEFVVGEIIEDPLEMAQQTIAVVHLPNGNDSDVQSVSTTNLTDYLGDEVSNEALEVAQKTVVVVPDPNEIDEPLEVAQKTVVVVPDPKEIDEPLEVAQKTIVVVPDSNDIVSASDNIRKNSAEQIAQQTVAVVQVADEIIVSDSEDNRKNSADQNTHNVPLDIVNSQDTSNVVPLEISPKESNQVDIVKEVPMSSLSAPIIILTPGSKCSDTESSDEDQPTSHAVVNYAEHLKNQDTDSDSDETAPATSMFYLNESNTDTDLSLDSPQTSPDADAGEISFKDRLSMFLVQNRPTDRVSRPSTPLPERSPKPDINPDSPFPNDNESTVNLFEMPRIKLSPQIVASDDGTPPPPPAFDAELYKTALRVQTPTLPTPDYDTEKVPPVIQKYVNSPSIQAEEVPNSPQLSFRNQLENILRREHSLRSSMNGGTVRPASLVVKTPEVEASVDVVADSVPEMKTSFDTQQSTDRVEDTEAVMPSESPAKLTVETIHRNMFKDVLKSINNNAQPGSSLSQSGSRRSSNKPATIEAALKSLRHVEGVEL